MFPTCPACKQSVLDDDAVDCPFCGASMKAKPGAAKPATAKPATKVSAPAPSAAPTKAAAKSSKTAAARPGANSFDADPLDLGEDFGTPAAALSAARSKSRSLEVQCPMCDTVGYTTPDNAGKPVKCVNPKCPMPVFTAPRSAAAKPIEPKPAKPKSNVVAVGGVTLAIMTVGGLLAWWIAGRPNTTTLVGPTEEDKALVKSMYAAPPLNDTANTDAADPKTKPDEAATEPTPKTTETSPQASIAPVLKIMNEASLQRLNRSKPYCRRLSAEAFALAGDVKGAHEQLTALAKVGPEVSFYRVAPLVQIAWQQLAKGQRKAAAKSVEEAFMASEKLPTTGRSRLEAVISLAAALVAVDRAEDAERLLAAHHDADANAVLAKDLCAVQALGTFDLAEMDDRRPAMAWSAPLTVGVIYELVGHQQSQAARSWADRLATDRERAEAVATWSDAAAWNAKLHSQSIPTGELRAAAEALPAPGNVLALARLGLSLVWAGDASAAAECLDHAATGLSTWEPPGEVALPEDLKELSKFELPDPGKSAFHVAAAGETAHLAAQLGQAESADELLTTALARARGLAPPLLAVQQRQKQIVSAGIAALRARIKEEWKLKTDEQARVAANSLQKNLDELAEFAQRRIDLQRQLLSEAAAWGRLDTVWTYIRRDGSTAEIAAADNLFFTELPALLAEKYRTAGNSNQAEIIATAWKQMVPNRNLSRPFPDLLQEAIESELTAAAVAQLLEQYRGEAEELDGLVLRGVCRQAAGGKPASALNFAARLADPVLREECFLQLAGMSARRSDTKAVEKQLAELQQASEKVAIGRGLIAGWVARPLHKSFTSPEQ